VSKERARRRAEREAAAAVERARRERTAARRRRWTGLRDRLRPRRTPGRRPVASALARQRSRQNGVLAAALVGLHTVVWLLWPSWWVRGSALVLTVLVWPLLVVLLYDRRPTA
jgi:Flp pilus assembly protein TadB